MIIYLRRNLINGWEEYWPHSVPGCVDIRGGGGLSHQLFFRSLSLLTVDCPFYWSSASSITSTYWREGRRFVTPIFVTLSLSPNDLSLLTLDCPLHRSSASSITSTYWALFLIFPKTLTTDRDLCIRFSFLLNFFLAPKTKSIFFYGREVQRAVWTSYYMVNYQKYIISLLCSGIKFSLGNIQIYQKKIKL